MGDQVYAALEPKNVTVSGGRIVGVGVGGLLLCGGYSYLTNQVSAKFCLPHWSITDSPYLNIVGRSLDG